MTLEGEDVTATINIREGSSTLFGSNAALFVLGFFADFLFFSTYVNLAGRQLYMYCRDGRREGAQSPSLRLNEPKKTPECSPRAGNAAKTCYFTHIWSS